MSSVRLGCMFIVFNFFNASGVYSPAQTLSADAAFVARWALAVAQKHEPAVHGRPPRPVTAPAGVSLRAAVARGLQPFASKAAVDAHLSWSRRLCRDGAARTAGGQAEQDLGQRLGADGACCHSQAADGDEAGGRSSAVGGRCGTDHQGRANSLPHDEAADRGRGRRALCARQACPVR